MTSTCRAAVVTGSNVGIGFEIVKNLCRQFDGDVYLTSIEKEDGEAAIKIFQDSGFSPKLHQLDVNDTGSVNALKHSLVSNNGGLDILVNNAAIMYKKDSKVPFSEQAAKTLQTNFWGVVNVCDALFPILHPHASDAEKGKAEVEGWSTHSYGISKLGVMLLTQIQQKDFDNDPRKDIIVNSCNPGWTRTQMGGPNATKSPEEGADTPTFLALLSSALDTQDPLPRGKFWEERTVQEWW
ncbi:CBR1 [Acanthosepion pharaonis]|uniref:CBR1 n=1 Tax=Acanthosepion pharaonis TaxID=158019 RepID=A0A812E5X8_ACAPH|nr:CBR1 [Sepia pharaonis]